MEASSSSNVFLSFSSFAGVWLLAAPGELKKFYLLQMDFLKKLCAWQS
jgi:hypothetical protein